MRRKQIYVDKKSFSVSAARINLMSIALKKNWPNSKRRKIRTVERDGSSRGQTLKTPNESKLIDPRVRIGHVHLKVADLERALNFYCGVLGFELTQRDGTQAAFVSGGGHQRT